jgi:hypothetical protein
LPLAKVSMETKIYSTHPVVRAIIGGTAPSAAQMAAAKGALPIPINDLLEVLVHLARSDNSELSRTALETFAAQQEQMLAAVNANEIAPTVLGFIAETRSFDAQILESVLTNQRTPDESILKFAAATNDGGLLELLAFNQQRLIRTPAILDAILANPARTAEAERRAQETRLEFFEKSRGAEQIAAELRAQGNNAAAEFLEQAEFAADLSATSTEPQKLTVEDAIIIARHIEVPDAEVDDSWLAFDLIEELYEETEEHRRAAIEKIISESVLDGEAAPERIALIRRLMMMNVKDRVKLAMKGDREARSILIRDSNKIVSKAVLQNPRITENEVEKIAAMRSVPDEVLRFIGSSRTWARNYSIIHNLTRNPRTPLPTAFNILPRIQTKDLKAISSNRNVSEAIRKQALRLLQTRK